MRGMGRGMTGALAACTCSLAFGVGAASAAETVGSNLTNVPGAGPAPNVATVQGVAPTAATLPLTATNPGVIVSIFVRHGTSGADPGIYGFRVLAGTGSMFSTPGAPPELPNFTWPANQTPGIESFTPSLGGTPKGIPISPGQRLGISRFTGSTGQGAQIWSGSGGIPGGAPGGLLRSNIGVHDSGPLSYGGSSSDAELLVQFRVEPDADLDGFGDETQDKCQGTAGTTAGCPAQKNKKKKKCKKGKKKKSADAAKKKKCKKKKK